MLAARILERAGELLYRCLPRAWPAVDERGAHTVGIVKPEQVRGGVKTGLAPIERMFGVALDVNRATLARLDQHWVRDFTFLESAGVVVGHARNDLFLLLGVGNHGCTTARQLAARARGQGGRGTEQREKTPTGHAIAFAVGVEQGQMKGVGLWLHRWQVKQLVGPEVIFEPAGTTSCASRWQARQFPMRMSISRETCSMVCTSPWQLWQAISAPTCGRWSK